MQIVELERKLQTFPLDEPVSIDGESVYLKVDLDGAELGVHFLESVTDQQLQDVLQLGFQNAMEFDAGWALSSDGSTLLLTQWLPGVRDWTQASEALEQLLNQVEVLRTLEVITSTKTEHNSSRDEQRVRSKLMKGE
jgi:hypothetical protein